MSSVYICLALGTSSLASSHAGYDVLACPGVLQFTLLTHFLLNVSVGRSGQFLVLLQHCDCSSWSCHPDDRQTNLFPLLKMLPLYLQAHLGFRESIAQATPCLASKCISVSCCNQCGGLVWFQYMWCVSVGNYHIPPPLPHALLKQQEAHRCASPCGNQHGELQYSSCPKVSR